MLLGDLRAKRLLSYAMKANSYEVSDLASGMSSKTVPFDVLCRASEDGVIAPAAMYGV